MERENKRLLNQEEINESSASTSQEIWKNEEINSLITYSQKEEALLDYFTNLTELETKEITQEYQEGIFWTETKQKNVLLKPYQQIEDYLIPEAQTELEKAPLDYSQIDHSPYPARDTRAVEYAQKVAYVQYEGLVKRFAPLREKIDLLRRGFQETNKVNRRLSTINISQGEKINKLAKDKTTSEKYLKIAEENLAEALHMLKELKAEKEALERDRIEKNINKKLEGIENIVITNLTSEIQSIEESERKEQTEMERMREWAQFWERRHDSEKQLKEIASERIKELEALIKRGEEMLNQNMKELLQQDIEYKQLATKYDQSKRNLSNLTNKFNHAEQTIGGLRNELTRLGEKYTLEINQAQNEIRYLNAVITGLPRGTPRWLHAITSRTLDIPLQYITGNQYASVINLIEPVGFYLKGMVFLLFLQTIWSYFNPLWRFLKGTGLFLQEVLQNIWWAIKYPFTTEEEINTTSKSFTGEKIKEV